MENGSTPTLVQELEYLAELHREGRSPREESICRRAIAALTRVAELEAAAQSAQAVAWRYRYLEGGSWKYVSQESHCNQLPTYERQPLYSAPPQAEALKDAWIPVSESKPTNSNAVLVTNGEWYSTGYWNGVVWFLDVQHESDPGINPVYWMPLPSAPTDAALQAGGKRG